ncbi:MAG: hypothetical protein V4574_22010 [Pseudomonadota bacterium]
MTKAFFALAALALAGCNPAAVNNGAEPANAVEENGVASADANATTPGNVLETVLAMPERQRNIVFVRALMDAGLKCEGVTHSERLPDMDGKPLWRADCKGGNNSHMITITPDGTANIVSRNDR